MRKIAKRLRNVEMNKMLIFAPFALKTIFE